MNDQTLANYVKDLASELNLTPSQLASRIGISYSSLFRVITGESSGSDSLVNQLVSLLPENSSITESDLRRAYVQARSQRKNSRDNSTGSFDITPMAESLMIKIITDTLANNNFLVTPEKRTFGFIRPDFVINTNAISFGNNEFNLWMFEFLPTIGRPISSKEPAQNAVKKLLQIIGGLHVFNGTKPDKTSLVVSDKKIFDEILLLTQKIMQTEDFISVILLDMSNQDVVEEVFLNQFKYKRLKAKSPFDIQHDKGNPQDAWPDIDL